MKDLDCVGLGRDSKKIESRSTKEMSIQMTIPEMGLSGEGSKETSDRGQWARREWEEGAS